MGAAPFFLYAYDRNGAPINGAQVNAYVKDTTTRQSIFTDAALTIPAANPALSDSAGRVKAYLNEAQSYSLDIKSADGSETLFQADFTTGDNDPLVITYATPNMTAGFADASIEAILVVSDDLQGANNVGTVAGLQSDMAEVSAIADDIRTNALISAEIEDTAEIDAEIITVAQNIASIVSNATNMAALVALNGNTAALLDAETETETNATEAAASALLAQQEAASIGDRVDEVSDQTGIPVPSITTERITVLPSEATERFTITLDEPDTRITVLPIQPNDDDQVYKTAAKSVHVTDTINHPLGETRNLAVTIRGVAETLEPTEYRKVMFSGWSDTADLDVTDYRDGILYFTDIHGNPSMADMRSTAPDTTSNTNDVVLIFEVSQSNGLEQTGTSSDAGNDYFAVTEFGEYNYSRIQTLGSTIEQAGDTTAISSKTLSTARDWTYGTMSSQRGRYARAVALIEGPASPFNGETACLVSMAEGGESTDDFLPPSYGGGDLWWNDIWLPTIARLEEVYTAAGKTVTTAIVFCNLHEKDHNDGVTQSGMVSLRRSLASELKASLTAEFPGIDFYLISNNGARLISSGAEIGEVGPATLGIIEAGMSDDALDADIFVSPPVYAQVKSDNSISHFSGIVQGHSQMNAYGAWTAIKAVQMRNAGQGKAKPSDIDWDNGYWTDGNTVYRVPATSRSGLGTWERYHKPLGAYYEGVPPIVDDGFTFENLPVFKSVTFDELNFEFVFTFYSAYSGSTGAITVALVSPDRTSTFGLHQMWNGSNGAASLPHEYVHEGPRCVWRIAQGEYCLSTGRQLYHYPQQGRHAVAAPA